MVHGIHKTLNYYCHCYVFQRSPYSSASCVLIANTTVPELWLIQCSKWSPGVEDVKASSSSKTPGKHRITGLREASPYVKVEGMKSGEVKGTCPYTHTASVWQSKNSDPGGWRPAPAPWLPAVAPLLLSSPRKPQQIENRSKCPGFKSKYPHSSLDSITCHINLGWPLLWTSVWTNIIMIPALPVARGCCEK